MVVLFVIATVLTFIIIDYFVQQREAQLAPAGGPHLAQAPQLFSSADDMLLPDGIFSANGHLWGELRHHGSLNVGIDPFLLNAMGRVDQVHLPQKGERVNKGDELFILQTGENKVHVRAPFSGIIERTNKSIEDVASKNIRDTWTVRIKPDNLPETIKSFRVGHVAKEWMKNEINHFRDFLSSFSNDPHLALTMQDGGLPVAGALATLNDDAWKKFEIEFLAVEK
jgi:glycine cleavage system H protein